MRAITLAAALTASALLVSACGIKGPLYLPQQPAGTKSAPPADHSKAEPAPIEDQ